MKLEREGRRRRRERERERERDRERVFEGVSWLRKGEGRKGLYEMFTLWNLETERGKHEQEKRVKNAPSNRNEVFVTSEHIKYLATALIYNWVVKPTRTFSAREFPLSISKTLFSIPNCFIIIIIFSLLSCLFWNPKRKTKKPVSSPPASPSPLLLLSQIK